MNTYKSYKDWIYGGNDFGTNYFWYYFHHYHRGCRFCYFVVFLVAISLTAVVFFLPLLLVLV